MWLINKWILNGLWYYISLQYDKISLKHPLIALIIYNLLVKKKFPKKNDTVQCYFGGHNAPNVITPSASGNWNVQRSRPDRIQANIYTAENATQTAHNCNCLQLQ